MQHGMSNDLFRLESPYRDPIRNSIFQLIKKPLAKVLRFETLNAMYGEVQHVDGAFVDRALKRLGVRWELAGKALKSIPADGPLMVVANHPYGMVEGLLLVKLLRQVRPDIRIMANYMLGMIPEMREHIIQVDPFGKSCSTRSNISGLKQSMRWLKDGGVLGVFPAGEVASLNLGKRMVADSKWSPMVAGIARKTGCAVLPVFFDGRHSALFQTLGMVHPGLRTMLLPHENLKVASGRAVGVHIGSVIPPEKLSTFASDEDAVDYMRFRTYLMRKDAEVGKLPSLRAKERKMQPVANSRPKHILASEVSALPDEQILISTPEFTVFEAGAFQIPRIIREIGVQREHTFRAVGEGTGKAMDIDRFDDTYRHLVLWNNKDREVAGAYRFARADEILRDEGEKGLYSAQFFDFEPGVLQRFQPALELGRSFILPKYQRSYQPLLLLWKGIAAYVNRHPRYTRLFGCVSVSGEYSGLSHDVIAGVLARHCSLPEASQVRPKLPPKGKALRRMDVAVPESAFSSVDDVMDMVADIENGRSIPVLLKQYLKLGGKMLGFNMDPDFGNCMDGLVVVDLLGTDERILGRFMGRSEAQEFLKRNGRSKVVAIRPAA